MERFCYMLPTNSASRQISIIRPEMRRRALFVTSRAAWSWNTIHLARKNADSPLAAVVVATGQKARCASGCQPPSVDYGIGSSLTPVSEAWSMPAYLATLAVHAAFDIENRIAIFLTTQSASSLSVISIPQSRVFPELVLSPLREEHFYCLTFLSKNNGRNLYLEPAKLTAR